MAPEVYGAHHGVLFLTSCPSSAAMRWRPSANPWKMASGLAMSLEQAVALALDETREG